MSGKWISNSGMSVNSESSPKKMMRNDKEKETSDVQSNAEGSKDPKSPKSSGKGKAGKTGIVKSSGKKVIANTSKENANTSTKSTPGTSTALNNSSTPSDVVTEMSTAAAVPAPENVPEKSSTKATATVVPAPGNLPEKSTAMQESRAATKPASEMSPESSEIHLKKSQMNPTTKTSQVTMAKSTAASPKRSACTNPTPKISVTAESVSEKSSLAKKGTPEEESSDLSATSASDNSSDFRDSLTLAQKHLKKDEDSYRSEDYQSQDSLAPDLPSSIGGDLEEPQVIGGKSLPSSRRQKNNAEDSNRSEDYQSQDSLASDLHSSNGEDSDEPQIIEQNLGGKSLSSSRHASKKSPSPAGSALHKSSHAKKRKQKEMESSDVSATTDSDSSLDSLILGQEGLKKDSPPKSTDDTSHDTADDVVSVILNMTKREIEMLLYLVY